MAMNISSLPCSTSRFKHPNDICVLPTGNNTSVLIVADTGNHAVRCINLRTDKVTTLLCGKNNKSNKKHNFVLNITIGTFLLNTQHQTVQG